MAPKIGSHQTDEHKNKISSLANERYKDASERMKYSRPGILNSNYGKPMSEEQKNKLRIAMTGRKRSEESKRKQSAAMKGIPKSEETKAKMRKPKSEEHKLKIGMAHKGRIRSEEELKNISISQTGKHHSPETILLLSNLFSGSKNPAWVGGNKKGYCPDKWTTEFRRRIRAFFENTCVECGEVQGKTLLHCHHVYFNKRACCEVSPDGKYYSNLGIVGNPNTFEIIGDPNKFVPLCKSCHAKTSHKSKREYYARRYESLVNDRCGGKSYLSKKEYEELLSPPTQTISCQPKTG